MARGALVFSIAISGLLGSCGADVHRPQSIVPAGAQYVAMGSSFAAGPGILPAEEPKSRCGRSVNNYAHQLAARRQLQLVDVSCGGATTKNTLERWNELPAQIDSITPETRLVTVTIGGNDVGYIGSLIGASRCAVQGVADQSCSKPVAVTDAQWNALLAALGKIAAEVRLRAPNARLIFVDYLTILSSDRKCAATAMAPQRAAEIRALASTLAAVTARAARESGSGLLAAGALSTVHDACSTHPWMNGFPYPGGANTGTPYHPTIEGMTMIASELDKMLSK